MDGALVYDPLTPAFRADPYPVYERFRREDPVHRSPFGFWVLSRHRDCLAMLRMREASVAYRDRATLDEDGERAPRSLKELETFLFLDPPDHTRLRTIVASSFGNAAMERLTRLVADALDAIQDRLREGDTVDFVRDFAHPVPVHVISRVLGLPDVDNAQLREWADAIARTLDPEFTQSAATLEAAATALAELSAYFAEEAGRRRARPTNDLIGHLVDAERAGVLSEREVVRTCILVLGAGHETSTNLLANGMLALLRAPDEVRRLRDRHVDLTTAIEELVRFDSPVQATKRIPLDAVRIDGRCIEAGTTVLLLLGSANRDEAAFNAPDRLDVGRDPNPHISFGSGIHFCVGARLAREEARQAFSRLAPLLDRLQIAGDITFRESVILRGLEGLDITLG